MSRLCLQELRIFMHKLVILVKIILISQRHTLLSSSIPITKFQQGHTC